MKERYTALCLAVNLIPYTLGLEPFSYALCLMLPTSVMVHTFYKTLKDPYDFIHIAVSLKMISKAIILVKSCEPPLYGSLCL